MTATMRMRLKKKGASKGSHTTGKGNENALRSGAFADLSRRNLDQRSKLARISLFEAATLSGNDNSSDDKYITWANSLRLDLQALGVARRSKQVMDLTTYVREQYRD